MTTGTDEKIDLVLVADDDLFMRLLTRTTLEQSGFTVVEASDGEAAIDLYTSRRPDIILLSWMS